MNFPILLITLILASRVLADPPSTTPAPIPEDQSTPRGALRVLAAGMDAGEGSKIRAVFRIANPQEQKLVDALVEYHEAYVRFCKAAVEAFGDNEARRLTGDRVAAQSQSLAALQSMPEEIKGDSATVGAESETQIHLGRVDGKWFVPVAMLAPGVEPAKIQQVIDDTRLRAAIYNDFTAELAADKHKTAEEAGDALQLKLMKAAMERANGAASQPATQPAPVTPQS